MWVCICKGVEDIDIWVDFVVGNLNKLQKLGLDRKINGNFNVFTLGPMAQATLVANDWMCEMLFTLWLDVVSCNMVLKL